MLKVLSQTNKMTKYTMLQNIDKKLAKKGLGLNMKKIHHDLKPICM
jgi:hypothetical protein